MTIVSMTAAAVFGKELGTLCLRVFQQQGQSATLRVPFKLAASSRARDASLSASFLAVR